MINIEKTPIILEDFLNYMETIKGVSSNTAKEYFYDIRTFFRFIKLRHKLVDSDINFTKIDISDVDLDLIKKLTIQDMHGYISYGDKKLNNSSTTRSRKVASLRSFFHYLYSVVNLIDKNPAEALEFPKKETRHPTYLTLKEAQHLLDVVLENKNEEYRKRDYAIITLFLKLVKLLSMTFLFLGLL